MEALIMPLIHAILGPLLDDGLKAYQAHINGEITKEQLKEHLQGLALQAGTDWVKSSNDAAVKTFDSFQQTLRVSKIAMYVWAYFMASQITFILWLEIGIPFVSYNWSIHYPGVGSLDTWAMTAVLTCLGVGPLVLKQAQPQIPKV
jgi:hypothetical protein